MRSIFSLVALISMVGVASADCNGPACKIPTQTPQAVTVQYTFEPVYKTKRVKVRVFSGFRAKAKAVAAPAAAGCGNCQCSVKPAE